MAAEESSVRIAGDAAVPPLARDATITPPDSLPSVAEPVAGVSSTPAYDDKTVISKGPPLVTDAVPAARLPQLLGSTLIGKRLEHYELTEFVGGGGMGAVFRATDTRLGRTVAVKVLSRDHHDEETIRRFKNEAQSAARLDHPNIARVHYVGEDHGWNFIVFEFIEGMNLRDDVERNGPLEVEQALHYTLQVAEALNHSSGRDVVHRDIKPSNVLVTAEGEVKLVDMGLARQHQVESSDDLTASGVMLGTFDYISPEQARDPRAADVRSDIYSLGCTLYFMLTGQPPFPAGTPVQKLLQHNSDDPPDVRQFRPELHPKISALLAKMLAKRPTQRQQRAAELIADIIELGRQVGLPSIAEYAYVVVVPDSWSAQWRDKLWQIAGAIALLALAIVGLELIAAPRQAGGDVSLELRFKEAVDPGSGNDTKADAEQPAAADQSQTAAISVLPASPAVGGVGAVQASNGGRSEAIAATAAIDSSSAASAPKTNSNSADATPAVSSRDPMSSSLQSSATPITDTAADQRIRRVVVLADSPAPPEPRVEYAATLAEACARAAELGISEIELRFSGPRREQPLEIVQPRLTIHAAAGHLPIVVFQPQARGDRHMIRLSGGSSGHVAFEGVELRLELPADSPADGWSLIAMSTGQSLELTDSVLTVKDGDAEHLPIHDDVAMIAVQRRRPGDGMAMSDMQLAMGQQARISLERTIARGEASLVSMTDETPLTVRWNQGLLITSKRLIETGGSLSEPQYYEQIVLDLDNVTAFCRQGLYYLRRGPGKGFQFHVSAYADHCIFVADPGVALFEMVGLAVEPETDELQSTGDGNRFLPLDMPFLSIRASSASEPQSFRLNRRWSSETRPQAGVPWLKPPPLDRPAHELSKRDFEIDVEAAASPAGFDSAVMPELSDMPDSSALSPSNGSRPSSSVQSTP